MLVVIVQAKSCEPATWLEACKRFITAERSLKGQGAAAGLVGRGRPGPLCSLRAEVDILPGRQWEPLRSTV